MVDVMPLLPMILSLLFLYLSINANEVHCYEEKALSLQTFQWKQQSGNNPSCLSRKSSEFGQREKVKLIKPLV
jgi:hypothetical protein